ncbi:MAG: mucoidy inhibitor MuiA family protein [Candidatus Ranarchaeia archaeon]
MSSNPRQIDTAIQALEAPLSSVSVFQGRAEMTHTGRISLKAGNQKLVIQNISPTVIPASIRVRAKGKKGAKAHIIKIGTKTRFKAQTLAEDLDKVKQNLKKIESKKEDLELEISHVKSRIKNFDTLWDRFTSSESWPKRFGMGQLTVKSLKEAEEFFNQTTLDLRKSLKTAQRRLKEVEKEYKIVKQQHDHLMQNSGSVKLQEVLLSLDVKTPGEFMFELIYHAENATWLPQYDIEVNGTKAKMTLIAAIKNRTLLDWNDVVLTVSTASAKPAIAVEPKPYFIDIIMPRPVTHIRAEAGYGKKTYAKAPRHLASPAHERAGLQEAEGLEELDVIEAEKTRIGEVVVYTLPGKISIPSDKEEHTLLVTYFDLDVKRDYWWNSNEGDQVVERLTAYNGDSVLLPGKTRTTVDGEYVGEGTISLVSPRARFSLTTQTAYTLKATKKLVDRKADEGLIRRDKATRQYSYELTMENLGDKMIEYNVFAVVPHSKHQKIEVSIEHIEPKPDSEQLGVIKWTGKQAPGDKKVFQYTYKVSYPNDAQIFPPLN